MGKTFAEKILALKSGKESVITGEIVTVSPDVVMSHDNTAAIAKNSNRLELIK
jgi:3-isopropylmalate dehydratase large subunit